MPYFGEPFDVTYYEGAGARDDGYRDYPDLIFRHNLAVAWADDIEATTGLVSGKDVLDIGCAYGFLTDELEARGANVIGVDLSAFAIGEANSRFPALTFVQEDFLANSFSNNQFHLSVAIGSLECMSIDLEIQTFLNEVNRVVRPTGIFYFLIDWDETPPQYYNNRTPAEWLAAMQAGLPGPYTFDVQDVGHLPLFYRTRVVVT